MLEMLRLRLIRSLSRWFVRWRWRGRMPTNVIVSDRRMDVDGGTIGIRIYQPCGEGPFPLMVYFHGGGWVGCDVVTHDPLCRELCTRAGIVVASVDYRLAPEYPFPVAPHDCLMALRWAIAHAAEWKADAARLFLGGDSAGGNLSAVVAHETAASTPGLVQGQVLIYPVTDHVDADTPSSREFMDAKRFNTKVMAELWELYLRNSPVLRRGQTMHPLATPLRRTDFGGLPPTFVVIAQDDPLRDEAVLYAKRMAEHGNDVQTSIHIGEKHGFVGVEGPTPGHERAMQEIVAWLRPRIGGSPA
jgi:acetyl esterase